MRQLQEIANLLPNPYSKILCINEVEFGDGSEVEMGATIQIPQFSLGKSAFGCNLQVNLHISNNLAVPYSFRTPMSVVILAIIRGRAARDALSLWCTV